jgi:predicted porin
MGQWGTPFKRARIYTGSGDTGHYGTSGLLTGHSTTTLDGASPQLFARRQANLITYDSPNFGGFQVSGAYTAINNSTSRPELSANPKPRLWGLSAGYANGPLKLNAAYEKHKQHLGAGASSSAPVPIIALGGFVGDEHGWLLSGEYTFANSLKLGGMWTRQTWDTTGVVGAPVGFKGEARVTAWQLGMDWMISGPHGIRAAYTTAGDVKGNGLAVTGGLRPAAGPSTGAKMAQIRYVHKLSKRTEFTLGYNQVHNDTFAGYNINGNGNNGGAGTSATGNGMGGKHNVFAIAMEHSF